MDDIARGLIHGDADLMKSFDLTGVGESTPGLIEPSQWP